MCPVPWWQPPSFDSPRQRRGLLRQRGDGSVSCPGVLQCSHTCLRACRNGDCGADSMLVGFHPVGYGHFDRSTNRPWDVQLDKKLRADMLILRAIAADSLLLHRAEYEPRWPFAENPGKLTYDAYIAAI